MAYGFNDDKSKATVKETGFVIPKFVVYPGTRNYIFDGLNLSLKAVILGVLGMYRDDSERNVVINTYYATFVTYNGQRRIRCLLSITNNSNNNIEIEGLTIHFVYASDV